ncbi:MAG: hypothetical protein ACRENP_27870 [Longimicrobiales bacterium]
MRQLAAYGRGYAGTDLRGVGQSAGRRGGGRCDPVHWDASAPCRRLRLTPSASGTLFISITWSGGPPLDGLITTSGGTLLANSKEENVELATAQAYLQAGAMYEVWVSSYYGTQVFDLRADLRPDTNVAPGRLP